jgi:hypothetical protein
MPASIPSILKVAVEELHRAWMYVVDAPDAENDWRDILCTGTACFAAPVAKAAT